MWSRAKAAVTAVELQRRAAEGTRLEEREERPKTQGCRVWETFQRGDSSRLHRKKEVNDKSF